MQTATQAKNIHIDPELTILPGGTTLADFNRWLASLNEPKEGPCPESR